MKKTIKILLFILFFCFYSNFSAAENVCMNSGFETQGVFSTDAAFWTETLAGTGQVTRTSVNTADISR